MKQEKSTSLTLRVLLISILLLLINCYWIILGSASRQGTPTKVSLFVNVVFIMFIFTLLNLLLRKFFKPLALKEGELLTIYVMLSLASALAGGDMIQVLVPIMGHAFWFATPENEWANLFHRFIPRWLAVDSKEVLKDYYRGESTLYTIQHIKAWIVPVLAWSSFIIVLLFVMLCINVIVRRRWIEQEKLAYPIIQLPLEMTTNSSGLFSSRLMWIGFAIAGGIDIINGLHFLYPSVPSLGGRLYDIRPYFTEKPWNAIGWTPIAVFPFAVGLGFFIPLDLSFSCWFFYLFWKVEMIFGSIMGWRSLPEFPYPSEQSLGAYVGICMIALWASRTHLKLVLKKVFWGIEEIDDKEDAEGAPPVEEPMSYRLAFFGLFFGGVYLLLFCLHAGMSVFAAVLFFVLYFAVSTAITRMRAELGSPVHDLHFVVDTIIPEAVGTRRLGGNNLTMFSFFYFFNRAHRAHPMPHQLEGFKLAERTRMNNKRLTFAMIIAIVLGTLVSFWACLTVSYKFALGSQYTLFGRETFNRLQGWLNKPTDASLNSSVFTFLGVAFAFTLYFLRMNFFWWPLHPAGYAVSGTWSMNVFWFSIFLSWIAKRVILKSGGLKTHRKAIPFFFGLIFGEFVIGSLWNVIGTVLHKPMYRFLY